MVRMGKTYAGASMLLAGIVILAAGWHLKRRFHAEVHQEGIGGFRFTGKGLAWTVGYLLFILGFCLILVSLLVIVS